jgi:tetratricopeptide (TPR) repeat protein
VSEFFDGYLREDEEAHALVKQWRGLQASPDDLFSVTSKKALKPPPSEVELVEIILTRGVDEAVRIFAEVRKEDPTAVFFSEERIIRFAFELGPARADDLIKLLEMNLEAYPESSDSYFWLGQAFMARGDEETAARHLQQCLELNPDNQRARRLLEKLKE